MKQKIVIIILMLLGFWLIFFMLQNGKIYNNTLRHFAKNWTIENNEKILVDKPYERLTNKNYIQWDAIHYKSISENGYNVSIAGGNYIFAFFPLFPKLWEISE